MTEQHPVDLPIRNQILYWHNGVIWQSIWHSPYCPLNKAMIGNQIEQIRNELVEGRY